MTVGSDRPEIFWLEDRPSTVPRQIKLLNGAQVPFYMYGTPSEFVAALADWLGDSAPKNHHLGFIIDIMLFGVADLRSLDIYDAPTEQGINAGYVFVDRYLRGPKSSYASVPVCFLTERDIDGELQKDFGILAKKSGAPIHVIQKFKDEYDERFIDFMTAIGAAS